LSLAGRFKVSQAISPWRSSRTSSLIDPSRSCPVRNSAKHAVATGDDMIVRPTRRIAPRSDEDHRFGWGEASGLIEELALA
jgi:hypothetical protein